MNTHPASFVRWHAFLMVALGLVTVAPALAEEEASAQGSTETDGSTVLPPLAEVLTGEASEAYDAARLLFADGDYGGASAKFQRAYELQADPRLLWNMAACEKEQRHYARASQLIESYLKEGGDRLPEQSRKSAEETLTALRGFSSRVTLKGAPDGARVLVDGTEVAVTPLTAPLHLDLGTRQLTVVLSGHEPFEKRLSIPGNTEITVEVDFSPRETKPAQAEATEQQEAHDAPERSSVLATKWPALAAAGVGLAGAAVWTIFGVQSMNAKSQSKAECEGDSCTDSGVSLRQDAIDAGNVATVGMIVTGVGLAAAGVLWFTLPTRKAESVATRYPVTPMGVQQVRVGAGVGTLQLSGKW